MYQRLFRWMQKYLFWQLFRRVLYRVQQLRRKLLK
ncbi:hypothetical protein FAEPRAM212_01550 [Faecalibacterium prausnitzii M21/2]|uniref:Uncharacterized protein n=1 Tax=Faecalibacterium prausnitzii M21/2 TaxID=411485 RepID=A8SB33_9FIRM|nr:hypothetical protein FAEPRAM212_01550 [Faecalibacterium prausnitzii M21/2]